MSEPPQVRDAVTDLAGRAVDHEVVRWAAERIVRQHTEPPSDVRATGRCAQCPCDPAGCELWRWARVVTDAAPDGP